MYRTAIRDGEDLSQAIVRASAKANEQGHNSYEIVCRTCGYRIDEHESKADCLKFVGILGRPRYFDE